MQVQKILTETDVYIKYGLKEKALEHLRRVFEIDHENALAYGKMRDIHLSTGNVGQAAEALANMINIHTRQGDTAAAANAKAELARLAPGHPLLTASSGSFDRGEVSDNISIDITEDSDAFELVDVVEDMPTLPPRSPQPPSLPEPMFAVVEPSAPEAPKGPNAPHAYATADLDLDLNLDPAPEPQINDPFDGPLLIEDAHDLGEPAETTDDNYKLESSTPPELPSGFLEGFSEQPDPGESTQELDEEDIERARADSSLGAIPDALPPEEQTQEAQSVPAELADDMEDELAEAEFMIEAEVYDDAKEILDQILQRAPGHPKAMSLLAQINGNAEPSHQDTEDSQGWEPGGMTLRPLDPPIQAGHSEAQTDPGMTQAPTFSSDDLDDAFGALESAPPEGGENLQHRFDEGMMYKEIGRLDAAIEAFESATRYAPRAIDSLEMIGHCYLEQKDYPNAIEYFARALEQGAEGPAAVNLKYEIGVACELSGDLDHAIQWFKRCHLDAPDHRDVEQRLYALVEEATDGEDDTQIGRTNGRADKAPDEPDPDPGPGKGPKKSKISYL